MATFSYDPSDVMDGSLNQMRFECGDICTENDGVGAFMSDEEYIGILWQYSQWKRAKYHCLNAIVMRLSYQVTYSAGGMSISVRERLENLKAMRDELKKELSTPGAGGPGASFFRRGGMSKVEDDHYFKLGMHDNLSKYGGV